MFTQKGIRQMHQLEIMYPFPIRVFDGAWHVLMARTDRWIKCDSRFHARTLSRHKVLINEAASNRRSGLQLSRELQSAARVLDRYGMGIVANLCRYYAEGNSNPLNRQRKPR